MDETQIYEPDPHESSPQLEHASHSTDESAVCDSWQKVVQSVIVLVIFISTLVMVHYYRPATVESALPSGDLERQVHELTAQVDQLKQEQAMPSVVLNHYRNSIGYIYGVYQVGFSNKRPGIRARVSGTGFLVGDGLLATNRHVAEPWFGDTDAEKMISEGAKASLETLVIFFPGEPTR